MTFFSMKKILVVMFCSLLFKTVNAGGPYTSCPTSVIDDGYDFSATPVETCPYPQFPNQTYYGGGDGNGVFFQACMAWAGSFSNTYGQAKKTGCTFYKEGFFYGSSYTISSNKWGCCNLADCNSACVRHIVTCAACADAQTSA